MRPLLRWKEFGKSCKCGDKSNYLTPAAAGTVGGNILGVESAPCGFANPRSVASMPTARLQRLHWAASQTRNSGASKPHSTASKPHTVASRCGLKSWHVTHKIETCFQIWHSFFAFVYIWNLKWLKSKEFYIFQRGGLVNFWPRGLNSDEKNGAVDRIQIFGTNIYPWV